MITCPCCGHKFDPDDQRITIETLRRWARENGFPVFPGDRVGPAAAAKILGKSEKTLKNWRAGGTSLPYCRPGRRRGTVSYFLRDLAEQLREENFGPE